MTTGRNSTLHKGKSLDGAVEVVKHPFAALRAMGTSGTAAIEFALIAPLLLMVLFGIFTFGMLMANYEQVVSAADAGARELSISRTDTTPVTHTLSVIQNAAPTLGLTGNNLTIKVAGVACSTDTLCSTAITAAGSGGTGSVQVTYPCSMVVMGKDYSPSCNLSTTATEVFQ